MGLRLMETEKDYYIFGSPAELVEKMKQHGFNNVLCIDGVELTERDIHILQQLNKGIVFLTYEPGSDEFKYDELVKKLEESGLRMKCIIPDCGSECDSLDDFVESFKDIESFEQYLNNGGTTRNWDYNGFCGNCHNKLEPEDKYCSACGTKRGQGKFEPSTNTVGVIYGAPMIYNYKCKHCGTTWKYCGFENHFFCPNCGERTGDYTRRVISFEEQPDLD